MKRVLIFIFTFLVVQNISFAQQTNLSFVYINGSNNNNEKMKNWYTKGVTKLHSVLKKQFETNKDTKTWFNETDGVNHINQEPIIFFWGDQSKEELDWVKRQLDFSKEWSPTIAYMVRSMLTSYLHDAIWVQKSHNMNPIVNDLNEVVKKEYEKGNNTVLFGYSAGTFITYEYLSKKLPYIDLEKLFQALKIDKSTVDFVKAHSQQNTCLSALEYAKVGVVSGDGKLLIDKSSNFKENYLKLDDATNKVCSPPGALHGIVNFASPLPLFYSDLADKNYEMTYYNAVMFKYIIEHGIFFLTVNFGEDPLGFPTTKNLTTQELEQFTGMNFINPTGFIYDNSGVWSKHSVISAHTSYWDARRVFSKAVVKTFVKGIKFNYDEEYQRKQLEKRDVNFDIW